MSQASRSRVLWVRTGCGVAGAGRRGSRQRRTRLRGRRCDGGGCSGTFSLLFFCFSGFRDFLGGGGKVESLRREGEKGSIDLGLLWAHRKGGGRVD